MAKKMGTRLAHQSLAHKAAAVSRTVVRKNAQTLAKKRPATVVQAP